MNSETRIKCIRTIFWVLGYMASVRHLQLKSTTLKIKTILTTEKAVLELNQSLEFKVNVYCLFTIHLHTCHFNVNLCLILIVSLSCFVM